MKTINYPSETIILPQHVDIFKIIFAMLCCSLPGLETMLRAGLAKQRA
jgi:hypothetical protein